RGPPRSSVPVQPAGSLRLSQLVLLSVLSDRDQPVLGEPQPQLLPGGHLSGGTHHRAVGTPHDRVPPCQRGGGGQGMQPGTDVSEVVSGPVEGSGERPASPVPQVEYLLDL